MTDLELISIIVVSLSLFELLKFIMTELIFIPLRDYMVKKTQKQLQHLLDLQQQVNEGNIQIQALQEVYEEDLEEPEPINKKTSTLH